MGDIIQDRDYWYAEAKRLQVHIAELERERDQLRKERDVLQIIYDQAIDQIRLGTSSSRVEEREACAKVENRLKNLVAAMQCEADNLSPLNDDGSGGQGHPAPLLRKWAKYIEANIAALSAIRARATKETP